MISPTCVREVEHPRNADVQRHQILRLIRRRLDADTSKLFGVFSSRAVA